jgi:hypothetical protein
MSLAQKRRDALIEPELEVGRAAGGGDAFVVGAGGFDDAGGGLADGGVQGLAGNAETGCKVRRADEEIDAGYGCELVEVLHRERRFDLAQQAELLVEPLLHLVDAVADSVVDGAGDAEVSAVAGGGEARVLQHLLHLRGLVDHGDIDDVGAALGGLEHVLAARVRDTDHGQHAGAGGHAAEIRGLGKGDGGVLHLNPDDLEAEVRGHFEEDGVVEVECGAEQGLAIVLFNGFAQAIHGILLKSVRVQWVQSWISGASPASPTRSGRWCGLPAG